ncbi:hypothetical protein FRB97_002079 [Tulasnella sp. 331]|nr:hypothetical protein FRB97_002079 [Tulasnella sp. 331]
MIFLALALPTLIYGKSRMPPKQQAISGSMKPKVTFYRNGVFWVFLAANILQSFAFFLPAFAHDLGLSTISGALLVALMNGVSVPGIIGIGLLSDAYDLRWCIILSTTGPALAILLVWGLSKNIATLLIFACIYGPLAGGFSSMWPKIIEIVAGGRADSQTYSTLFSIFNASRGLGNVLSGLVAAKLIEHSPLEGKTSFGYGLMGYGSLILFTGGCMLASTIAVAYPLFRGPLMEPPNGPNPVPVSERDVNQNETV